MYDYSEEITDYLFRQMSELQREAFERRLEWDKELAAEVARQKEMLDTIQAISAIKEAQEDPYYDEVDKITTEILESRDKKPSVKGKQGRKIILRRFAAVAAVAALFFIDFFTKLPAENIRRSTQKHFGFRTSLTKNTGRKLGRFIAKNMARIRKR